MSFIRQALSVFGLVSMACAQTPTGTLTLQEALESTLRQHPQGHIREQQVAASRGALREATGIFDPVYASGMQQSFATTPLTTIEQGFTGSGPSSRPRILQVSSGGASGYRTASRRTDRQLHRSRDRLSNASGINHSRLAYQITILLAQPGRNDHPRGCGRWVEASQLDLNQTLSDLLSNTAVSYWLLVGATRLLK
jgi:hypothetical protein